MNSQELDKKASSDCRTIQRVDILRNERLDFGPDGKIVLDSDSIPGLVGKILIDSNDNTLSWINPLIDKKDIPSRLNCQIFVVPFHELKKIYSLEEKTNDNLVKELETYNVNARLEDNQSITIGTQNSIIFKETPKYCGQLGMDIARFNYVDMSKGEYLESVTIEQRLPVSTGEAVNLSYYLRRGKGLVYLVAGHNNTVYQWANVIELGGFMPPGYVTETGMRMDQPYNMLHDHTVTLEMIKDGVEVCASARDGHEKEYKRFGVRYMGELITNSPVTVKPRQLSDGEDVFSLEGDLISDPSLVGIEFDGSTKENRQSLAIFRIVEDSENGNLGLVYIKSTDLGNRVGSAAIKYSPILPANDKPKVDQHIIYAGPREVAKADKEKIVDPVLDIYQRLLKHAQNFKVDPNFKIEQAKRADHPALLFRQGR